MPAKLRFEYSGQNENRRLHLETGMAVERGKGGKELRELGPIAAAGFEFDHRHDPQQGIEHHPGAGIGDCGGGLPLDRYGAVQLADRPIGVQEEAELLGKFFAVLGVGHDGGDAEKGDRLVVEQRSVRPDDIKRRCAVGVRQRSEKAEHDIAAGNGVEFELRIDGRSGREQGGGIADREIAKTMHGPALRLSPPGMHGGRISRWGR